MTIEEHFAEYLTGKGMFAETAAAVIASVKEKGDENGTAALHWSDELGAPGGYPDTMIAVLTLTIDAAAVEWIDANAPQAWYRPLFAGESETPGK